MGRQTRTPSHHALEAWHHQCPLEPPPASSISLSRTPIIAALTRATSNEAEDLTAGARAVVAEMPLSGGGDVATDVVYVPLNMCDPRENAGESKVHRHVNILFDTKVIFLHMYISTLDMCTCVQWLTRLNERSRRIRDRRKRGEEKKKESMLPQPPPQAAELFSDFRLNRKVGNSSWM